MLITRRILTNGIPFSLAFCLVFAACSPTPGLPTDPHVSPTATAASEPDEPPLPTKKSATEPIRITDGMGREVSLAGPARRIVSLAPSNVEVLFAIGAGSQLVGRDDFSDFPPEAAMVESIGNTFADLNTEAILALEPDLVLAAEINSPEEIHAIEALGIPIFQVPNPLDFEGLFTNLAEIGKLTGHESEAEALADALRARVEAVIEITTGAEPAKVYYEVDGTDPTAPWTTGSGTFQDVLITLAGGENIAADIEGWGQISLEELIVRNPDLMIFEQGVWVPTTVDNVAERTGWGDISAVVNGTIVEIDTNWIGRPGPRLVDALEAIAKALHPELFE